MKGRVQARTLGLVAAAVAVPLLAASFAYACAALASLSVNPGAADAGQTVSGYGQSFSNTHGGSPSIEPVVVRFNSRTGPVLWSGRPDNSGNISFSFVVPKVTPGQYTIIATQNNADGQPAPGTPARAAFQVTGVAEPVVAPTVAAPPADPAPAPAAAPVVAPAPAPAPAPARTTAPARVSTPAPAPVATPAPVVAAAPEAVPAPVVTPAPAPAPAVTPAPAAPAPAPAAETPEARRSVMVSMADSDGSPWLAIGLVGLGLVLSLGATALVLAGRRESKAPVGARRS